MTEHEVVQVSKYRLQKKLGSGTFGDVYSALRVAASGESREKPVAIKLLRKHPEQDPEEKARELAALATLREHPHANVLLTIASHDLSDTGVDLIARHIAFSNYSHAIVMEMGLTSLMDELRRVGGQVPMRKIR